MRETGVMAIAAVVRMALLFAFAAATAAGSVAVAILAVVILGASIGSLLPLAIRRAGFDPAVSSTPFIMSTIDVIGLLVYFALARVIFSILL